MATRRVGLVVLFVEIHLRGLLRRFLCLVLDQLADKLVLALKVLSPVGQRLLVILVQVLQLVNGSIQRQEHVLVERVLGQSTRCVPSSKVSVGTI